MPTEKTLSIASIAPIQITAIRSTPNTSRFAASKPAFIRASATS